MGVYNNFARSFDDLDSISLQYSDFEIPRIIGIVFYDDDNKNSQGFEVLYKDGKKAERHVTRADFATLDKKQYLFGDDEYIYEIKGRTDKYGVSKIFIKTNFATYSS